MREADFVSNFSQHLKINLLLKGFLMLILCPIAGKPWCECFLSGNV